VGFLSESDREEFGQRASDLAGTSFESPTVYDDPVEVARIVERLRGMAREGSGVFGAPAMGSMPASRSTREPRAVQLRSRVADVDLAHVNTGNSPADGLPYNTSRIVTSGLLTRGSPTPSHTAFSRMPSSWV